MKRVLLLGDSISMGYREYVRELLAEEADVQYMEENGRFAKYTMWAANQWIRSNGAPDIVHWNNGVWDITIEPPLEGSFTPLPRLYRGAFPDDRNVPQRRRSHRDFCHHHLQPSERFSHAPGGGNRPV